MNSKEKCYKYIMAILFSIFACYTLISVYVMYSRYVISEHTDVNTHIYRALAGGGYSLNSIIIRLIDNIARVLSVNEIYLFVAYNVLIVALTIILLAISMQRVLLNVDNMKPSFLHMLWLSLMLQFTCIIHIPAIYPWFYRNITTPNLSPLGTQPWNSDTYNLMRMFSGVALFLFIILFKQSSEKRLSHRDLVLFAFFLFLTNFAKPSFVVCFAPAAFLVCLISLGKNGYYEFLDYVKYGFAILISLCCIPFQYERLYGENTGSGITFTLDRISSVNICSLGGGASPINSISDRCNNIYLFYTQREEDRL